MEKRTNPRKWRSSFVTREVDAFRAVLIGTQHWLKRPVDISSLVAFRVLFGLIMAASALRYLEKGWVQDLLAGPSYHFTYEGFDFVRPLEPSCLHFVFATMIMAALGIAFGAFYRISTFVFLLSFGYIELIDRALYLNHYYLATSLALLLTLLPLGRAISFDAWYEPHTRVTAIPAWVLYVMRIQVAVVYLFAGVAKLQEDWLVHAQPLRIWLAARDDLPILGALLHLPITAHVASVVGAAFDLAIVPALVFPRTRKGAFITLLIFHTLTGLLFPIGIFPWLMSASATLFFTPSWPRRALPALASSEARTARPSTLIAVLLTLHCVSQIAIPLVRHLSVSARESAWTRVGFDFSWRVMVAEKSGCVRFIVRDRKSGERLAHDPRAELSPLQAQAMAQDPALIQAYALHVADTYRLRERREVAVFADAFASLNGRASKRMLPADMDLTAGDARARVLGLQD